MLNKQPARPLTSREIAKIVSGIMTGFIEWCDSEEVIKALDHFIEHRNKYVAIWQNVENKMKRFDG